MSNRKEVILEGGHWDREDHSQRMTREDWKWCLLNYKDTVVCRGVVRQLKSKNIGSGVVEVFKVPKK